MTFNMLCIFFGHRLEYLGYIEINSGLTKNFRLKKKWINIYRCKNCHALIQEGSWDSND